MKIQELIGHLMTTYKEETFLLQDQEKLDIVADIINHDAWEYFSLKLSEKQLNDIWNMVVLRNS